LWSFVSKFLKNPNIIIAINQVPPVSEKTIKKAAHSHEDKIKQFIRIIWHFSLSHGITPDTPKKFKHLLFLGALYEKNYPETCKRKECSNCRGVCCPSTGGQVNTGAKPAKCTSASL